MPRPTTKDGLLTAAAASHAQLLGVIDSMTPAQLAGEFPFEDRDRSVRDVVGHLHAWQQMMLTWYSAGSSGQQPVIPAPGFTWRDTPALNQAIWARYQDCELAEVRAALEGTQAQLMELIQQHTDEELFTKRHYAWTGTTSLGAYLISATCSHDEWALKKLRKYLREFRG